LKYDYNDSYQRNLGILSEYEQNRLKGSKVAVVGVGGVGGAMAMMLARSGVANFTLIDPDKYELSNTNRHINSYYDTQGEYKTEVTRKEILRINPEANVEIFSRKLSLDEIDQVIETNDVIIPAADDVAFSSKVLIKAQEQKKCAVSAMPSGLTGYILVFNPSSASIIDPSDIFGGPKGLPYQELREFLENPAHKCGRRWYITKGKWRIDWFQKWRQGQAKITHICPNVWLGASLACIEVIKYMTGKWQPVEAPRIWNIHPADNKIEVSRFRRRTWFFSKYIVWAFNIKWLGIGKWVRNFSTNQNQRQIEKMEKQEKEGRKVKYPFLWKHII
jgi:molybdopterin/thiamine biosynthesis adenylyltransferase